MACRRIRTVSALVAVLGAVGMACGADGDDDGDAASTGRDVPAVATDFGADRRTIRVGLLSDLTGPFSVLLKDAVLAQEVYWERVNAAGGIAGRRIDLVVVDQKYDIPTHKSRFAALSAKDEGGVLILSQSAGSPHTAAIKADLEAAGLIAIPFAFFSAWADPVYGKHVFEAYSNTCFQAINTLQYMFDTQNARTVAIVSFPGEFGQDSARGAKLAAEGLGMRIVYDGEAKVVPPSPTNPNPDNSGIVSAIVGSRPDVVWVAVNPSTLPTLIGPAAAKGYRGLWAGAYGAYHEALLKSDVKHIIDSSYFASSYTAELGVNVPGMADMIAAIRKSKPGARASDAYVLGWTEAHITDAILRKAAELGDLTRAGVLRAAFELDKVDFGGLAPRQTWKGDPNAYVVRETYVFKPKLALFKEGMIGEGRTGGELLKGPFASPITQSYDFNARGGCFKPAK
ncbi:MAG TPA: ABC transporter substrate-binding protein [Acidimicrobiia bacterium]|nr:ABC transporter substrate-binding protein [Acidimicrobiia bacterium]